ncbi:two-component sensor histidine kinase [Flavobacterium nitrogenifigens]|uniref:histidine kinase n=2 Tax=Flavobacterium TaxID=237 RepID=A0A7W7N7D7_9FLAO|nr:MULTISPECIES: sensor histidine kinase [Flavobacterium]MBB4802653.1 two-component sensor histidine kinase [Flavobacterium nitrogenifigens]MBB6387611.1 two-component sensor histidine kinase [Flavobacterium notoginsengisoli]
MFSKQIKVILFLLVLFTIGDGNAWVILKNKNQIETAEKSLSAPKKNIIQDAPYTDQQVKDVEPLLARLPQNINKVKVLLKVSDWYEISYDNPKTLEKAYLYAQDALRISQKLHSSIYIGKCYLQLSMVYQLKSNDKMIEVCAKKAIAAFTNTDQINDLAESWVMVWSAKMRTHAPLAERFSPIFKAAALFEKVKNNQRVGDCYSQISELYFSQSDFESSLTYLKKALFYYRAAHLDEEAILPISSRLHIIYEAEKRSKDIIKLKNKTFLQQIKLKNEVFLRNSMITFVVLLLIILGLLYKSYRFKKKTNKMLETQQNEINKKNTTLQNLVIEKEWLLKEIHHRVKNNLHMVVGLLASQVEFLKNEEAVQAINNSQNRIQAMSLIHQKLYQSENLSIIDMPSYIFELTEYLKDSFEIRNRIRFILDIDPFHLPLSHSIPIGLIFNEAVTNAIKYAFPNHAKGIINISLKASNDQKYKLIIHDNGVGLPPDFDPYNNPSLGIKLMHGLSADIEGKFLITNVNGTKITLEFTFIENNLN